MERPLIGVTCGLSSERCNDLSPNIPFYHVYTDYCEAIWNAGGDPVILPPIAGIAGEAAVEDLLENLDGVFFSGGGLSTAPKTAALEKLMDQQPVRSQAEQTLIHSCRRRKMPIIGSCRGHQMICESLGGTMAEGCLEGHSQSHPYYAPKHSIAIVPDTKLAAIIGGECWNVNSMHRQYVKNCPADFRANAFSPEGCIEGMEAENADWFCITFQYHPEMMTYDARAQGLLKAFVDAAKAYKNAKLPMEVEYV